MDHAFMHSELFGAPNKRLFSVVARQRIKYAQHVIKDLSMMRGILNSGRSHSLT
jgi:hypothetical protein